MEIDEVQLLNHHLQLSFEQKRKLQLDLPKFKGDLRKHLQGLIKEI